MKISISAFENGSAIPIKYAFCMAGKTGPVDMAQNINPQIEWSNYPEETKSFALMIVDTKVPSKPDDVNQEGKSVSKDLPRVDFYHLLLCDIPKDINKIPEGSLSNGITPKGKKYGKIEYGNTGINSYTDWFTGDENMEGFYGSYDGPCPPWNDELIHEYYFKIFALDIENLNLPEKYNGEDLKNAIEGHILDKAEHFGTYTANKKLL